MIFKESKLGSDFAKSATLKAKKLIASSTSVTVVGMPGMGISMFLRYLACNLPGCNVIHIDINELKKPSKDELLKLKELKNLEKLVHKYSRVVIIFNRFDNLQGEFDKQFFGNLRSLRDIDKEKIVMVFSANKPLPKIAPEALSGGNLNMFSKSLFLEYSDKDLEALVKLNSPNLLKHKDFGEFLKLAGGHYQFLQLLLKEDQDAVTLQLKEIYENMDYKERKFLQKHLETAFSPLFADYVKSVMRLRLPVKEAALFKLLKGKLGKLVSKDEIFNELWQDEVGSDWALNALIYRLRKNPTFVASGYIIESKKKVGYSLIKV